MEPKHTNFIGKYHVHEIPFGKYKIKSYIFGHGDKVIFSLPSFPHSGLYYLWFISHYNLEKVKFITFDFPGWIGGTDNIFVNEVFSLDRYIQVAEAVLAFYGVKEFSLIGYSFGGALAIRLAVDHPESVKKLVLVSAFVDGNLNPQGTISKLLKYLHKLKWGWLLKIYVRLRFRIYEDCLRKEGFSESGTKYYERLVARCDGTVLLQSISSLFNSDWTDYLRRLRGSRHILVISSKDESGFLKAQSEHIRRELEHEKTMFIHGNHEDFLLKPNTEVVKAVVDFMTGD